MARSVNKVILVGNLGRDAETKFTQSGKAVTRFSLATSRPVKNPRTNEWEEETNWSNVVIWEQEKLAEFLTKGKQVYIDGRLQTRNYNDKEGHKTYVTEIIANEVVLLGGKADLLSDAAEPQQSVSHERPATRPQAQPSESEQFAHAGVTDDDVPF